MRTLARLVGRLFLSLGLGLGWLAFVCASLLFIGEETGILDSLVRDALADEAGALGPDLRLERATLRWFEPALEIDDLELGPAGESIRLRRVKLYLEISYERGLHLARARIDGGHLRISPALINGIRGLTSDARRPARAAGPGRKLPIVEVQGLDLDLETHQWGRLPLGRVDAVFSADERGLAMLQGRMIPSLASIDKDPGEIRIEGHAAGDQVFEVNAAASHLPLATDYVPAGTVLDSLRPFDPRGFLDLSVQARFSLDGSELPRASARLALKGGSFLAADKKQRFDDLDLELEAGWSPASAAEIWTPPAWRSRASLAGVWNTSPFEIFATLGESAGAGLLAKAWLHVPRFPLTRDIVDLAGGSEALSWRWNAFGPRGEGEVWASIACPSEWKPSDPLLDALAFGLELGSTGKAGLTYNGWPNLEGGASNAGFPLPLQDVIGTTVCARDPRRLRPFAMGLVGLSCNDGSGTIRASGTVISHAVDVPPFQPGIGQNEIDLRLSTEHLALDDRLRSALRGLVAPLPPFETWEPFHPEGGSLSVDLRLVRNVDMPYCAVDLSLGIDEAALSWNDLPIPVSKAHGHLAYSSDGRSEHALALELSGSLPTAKSLKLGLRMQTDPAQERGKDSKRLDQIENLRVDVERVSLTGSDRKILVAAFPEIGLALEQVRHKGFIDATYERVRDRSGGSALTTVEAQPHAERVAADRVQLQYKKFEMNTTDVRGRVLVTSLEEAPRGPGNATEKPMSHVETRIAPLVGRWDQGVDVALVASFPEGRVRVFGAGIDPASKSLRASLIRALAEPGAAADLDITAIEVTGLLDASGEIRTSSAEGEKGETAFRVYLRDDSLRSAGSFRLDGLRGVLDWKDDVLHGERLDARLADTPVELSDVRFSTTDKGFRFETRLRAPEFPLDEDHLRSFVDPVTLAALLGELHWQGRIDIDDGRITIAGPRQGDSRLEFTGTVTPSDMAIQLGLPLSIRSAKARVEALILEGGKVRAFARIEDLYGRIADRELAQANLLVTYVEPRLSIEDLSGKLEGGDILPLGQGASRGGTAFSIDLVDPFPFQLALELRDVEMAGLLRGLFVSSVATKGRLNAQIRLTGDTEDVLGIQGSGSLQVKESRLWSIPVFRALFSRLGLDNSAVFDRMSTKLRIKGGVIEMADILVHSPLLQLAGHGTIDFDGGLKHDLEVRYDLVDRLGPFTRLLYAIQNELLSVAIRGDMSRPEVILKNPFTSLFSRNRDRYRALPLPGYAPLPARF